MAIEAKRLSALLSVGFLTGLFPAYPHAMDSGPAT